MKIASIHLRHFKRFTNLRISELPESAKLVVLIGPNGSGKSSVFDALHAKAIVLHRWGWQPEHSGYWNKTYADHEFEVRNPWNNIDIQFHGSAPSSDKEAWARSVYVRSAHRNNPSIELTSLSRIPSIVDEPRPQRLIDNDAATTANYIRLVSTLNLKMFDPARAGMTLGDFLASVVGSLRDAVERLFDNPPLQLNDLGSPLVDSTFRFTKGAAQAFSYENLSGGEKAAFDLLLDLVVKTTELTDTVFCIDEPEAHMGLRLQGSLLRELYGLVPDNCQLWIATHSVGVMRAAHALNQEHPGAVVFLDFGGRDFDDPTEIRPATIDHTGWRQMHDVLLEDVGDLVVPDRIVFCEGEHGFDAHCYGIIFGEKYPDTAFVSVGGKRDLGRYRGVFQKIVKAQTILLRDRDNMSDPEVQRAKLKGISVLGRPNIEYYLLDGEVLDALCNKYAGGDPVRLREARAAAGKKEDPKAAAEDLRMWAIKVLGVHNAGDNRVAFLQDTMAPLVRPGLKVYAELERDVFGE